MSCDEAYLELTGHINPLAGVEKLRQDIFETTGCTVSAGVGPNMLLARICTSKAKPNGMFVCPSDTKVILDFLGPLAASSLPGVGWTNARKLQDRGVLTVQHLREVSKVELEALIGHKLGQRLYDNCRGIDNRSLQYQQVRKSIGAEVNWGIRFTSMNQAREFLMKLSQEVADRMVKAGREFPLQPEVPISAKTLTFKVMLRHPEAGEPFKHMGHGHCNNSSKTVQLLAATHSADIIADHVIRIFESMCHDPTQARGIGIQMTRLCHPGIKQSADEGSILPFVAATKRPRTPPDDDGETDDSDSEAPPEKRVRFDVSGTSVNVATQPDSQQRESAVHDVEVIEVASKDPSSTPPRSSPDEPMVQALTLPPMFRRRAPKKAEVIDLAFTQRSAEVTCLSQPVVATSEPAVHPPMFVHETFTKVAPVLTNWIRAIGASPAPHHAKLIVSYGKFLAGHGLLEDATQLLRWLERVSTSIAIEAQQAALRPTVDADVLKAWSGCSTGSATWQDAFRAVEEELQRTLCSRTGKELIWR
jgi:nucleotidyltransferase/DNA polymerase involved in DNA repair